MHRLYDDNLYQFDKLQPSYWEATSPALALDASPLDEDIECDVAIVGGGYTGLSAAMHLARDYGINAHVLEAGPIGWGASGRNGGFCCIGGTGIDRITLIKRAGVDRAREYFRSQIEAVDFVRELLERESIDAQICGDGEIEIAHSPNAFEKMHEDIHVLTDTLGIDAELLSAGQVSERLFASNEQFGAVITRPTFGLNPLMFCRGLARAAVRHGASLHPDSLVTGWTTDRRGYHRLQTPRGTLTSKRVVYATNGFIQEALQPAFRARTLPVISAIIVTRALSMDEKARYHWQTHSTVASSRRVLNYYRILPDNRLLFGGRGQSRGSAAAEKETYASLTAEVHRLWPAWRDIDIDYRWHGLICMTRSLVPALGKLPDDPGIWFGYGYHGNGVNTATWAGGVLADWIGTGEMPLRVPAIVKGRGGRFPLPALRIHYLRAAIQAARWLDKRG